MNQKLEEKWKIVRDLDGSDDHPHSDDADDDTSNMIEPIAEDDRMDIKMALQDIEIKCTDQIVSLLTVDEVKELIRSILDFQFALQNGDKV